MTPRQLEEVRLRVQKLLGLKEVNLRVEEPKPKPKLKPKLGNWTTEEYGTYWVYAMQWLPTVMITSVPDNKALQWQKVKWDEQVRKVVDVGYDNEGDYLNHLRSLATMYAEACSTIALVLESEATDESAKNIGKELPKDKDLPIHYVTCLDVATVVRKRSDVVARTLRSASYPVIKKVHKNYCDPKHAAVLYPKWKKYLKRQQENE